MGDCRLEATVNRVGDVYFSQMDRNGHAARADDLDLFAGLGIRALRYPVLWELTAPDGKLPDSPPRPSAHHSSIANSSARAAPKRIGPGRSSGCTRSS